MLKRIDLHIEFPKEMMIDDIKIPKTYKAHIWSNTNETDIDVSYKQIVNFFEVYKQNVNDYEFYCDKKNGNKVKLSNKDIGKMLISPSFNDETVYCIYRGK